MRARDIRDRRSCSLNAQTKAIFVILSLILPPFATAETYIFSGTIIVIAQTKRRVIIAADSRSGATTDGTTVKSTDDTECKIGTFGGNAAFSAAGVIGNRVQQWTAVSQAVEVIKSSTHRPIGSKQGEGILDMWAESMMRKLVDFSPGQLRSYANMNEGLITTGVLAGVEKGENAWIHAATIKFAGTPRLSYQTFTLVSNDPPTACYFLGKSQIGLEFERDNASSRAIEERKVWGRKNLTGASLDRFKARRLVELTVMYHPNKTDVGGPVRDSPFFRIELAQWIGPPTLHGPFADNNNTRYYS